MANTNPTLLIEDALDVLAAEASSDFEKTMRTWREHRSPVHTEKKPLRRTVYVADPIYSYLNFGTEVRRALLTPDWHSKTAPGVIGSAAGQGSVITVRRSFEFPGIKARDWDLAIVERIEREVLPKVMNELSDKLVTVMVEALRP